MMHSEDLKNCGDAFVFLGIEVVVDSEIQRCRAPEGCYQWDRHVVRTTDLVGRRKMMMYNMSWGRQLMRSRSRLA
jgi:hypothetical protein